jgi:hypothetical protein
METGRPFTTAFNIGEMLDAYDTPRAHAPTHSTLCLVTIRRWMRRYPPPRPEMEGIVIRLDVAPSA